MNTLLRIFAALLLTASFAHSAGVRISDLGLSTSPSDNTYLEIADLNASGTNKSAKILYTNLATRATVNAAQIWTNAASTLRLANQTSNVVLKLSADDGAGSGAVEFWTGGSKRWTINNGGVTYPEGLYDWGTLLNPIQAVYASPIGYYLSDRLIAEGSGSPEGSKIAPVASLFLRGDGAAGTTLYTKTAGTGNTGWDPVPSSNSAIGALGITIDGGGGEITTGIKGDIYVPYNCTIQSVTMLADVAGAAVVDIWKDVYANYPPTVANSITASAKPTITSTNKSTDATLTGWGTGKTVTAGDTLRFNVDSAATITRLTLTLKVLK